MCVIACLQFAPKQCLCIVIVCMVFQAALSFGYSLQSFVAIQSIYTSYYMASITSGKMADCDWLRSTFSGPLRKNI